MKLAIRIFALTLVVAGGAAATFSSAPTRTIASHLSATDTVPAPGCGPHIPTCPTQPPPSN